MNQHGPYHLRRRLTWTDPPRTPVGLVLAVRDVRAERLAALLDHAFRASPCYILGAGASVPLVQPRLSARAITEFVLRHQAFVPENEAFTLDRALYLAAILGVALPPGRTSTELWWIIERAASDMKLAPAVYKDLVRLSFAALTTLICAWLTAEASAHEPGPHRAGYDILEHVPNGSLVLTTNQDGLAKKFAPHLDVRALNGEVESQFVNPATRLDMIRAYAVGAKSALPQPFVLLGQQQPMELFESEEFRKAWALSSRSSAIVIVGYSFAAGLDIGCWDEFRLGVGRSCKPVHIVDPNAVRLGRDVAYGLSHAPAAVHPLYWNRLSFVLLRLMRERGLGHPAEASRFAREVLRLHDEIQYVEPMAWAETLATNAKRTRPKSLLL